MKHSSFLATLAILMASGIPAGAGLENRLDSLGPLKRYDPNEPSPEFLVKVHGDPRKGLPEMAADQVQRVSDKTWYLEMGRRIARMEANYVTGQVVIQDIIEANAEWSVSPDGKLIFACRPAERAAVVGECFDLATGESKWTFEKGMTVMDVCFTPDGSQVVIFHSVPSPPVKLPPVTFDPSAPPDFETLRKMRPPTLAAVSWYDAKSGEMKRRVNVPGTGAGGFGAVFTDYLACSGDRVYVARPSEDAPSEGLVIKAGATEAEKIEVGAVSDEEKPCVRVGGTRGEFVTFYSDDHVVLFHQEENGKLTQLKELALEGTQEGNSYSWCARFTPDGNRLVVSSCFQTIHLATHDSAEVQRKEFPGGSQLADFSADGNYFVTFDDGGGRVRKTSSWEMMESFETRIRPPHCCPITEAGFSITGNYIISSDDVRLLLWSREGEQLAELYSARSDTKEAVRMQSPVVVEEQNKVYAADGYDFLAWDLTALKQRLSRKPDNIPRVKGEVVFNDRAQKNSSPELMNILVDPKGEHIITATRSVVRYRPLATSDPVNVPVPKDDIFSRPRMFMDGIAPGTVIVRPGTDAYSLDLTGKNASVRLAHDFIGTYAADDQKFAVMASGGSQAVLTSRPIETLRDAAVRGTPVATLPADWHLRTEFAILSPDGKWVIAIPTVWGKGSVVAIIDVAKREIVRSQPVHWTATSVSMSNDGKRLLVGSTNRAVYEFDFQKMTGQP